MVSGVWAEQLSVVMVSEHLPRNDSQPADIAIAAQSGEFSLRFLTV